MNTVVNIVEQLLAADASGPTIVAVLILFALLVGWWAIGKAISKGASLRINIHLEGNPKPRRIKENSRKERE